MIVGRARESALIEESLGSRGPVVLLVRGAAGLGKTALIDEAVRRRRTGDDVVLRAHGYQGATSLPFAALHQLLRPMLGGLDALPGRERRALRAAFALDSTGTPPQWQEVARAALALLSGHGVHLPPETGDSLRSASGGPVRSGPGGPVLLVVDDAQWCDRDSLDVAAFVARQAAGRRIILLAGTRGTAWDGGMAELLLGPLPADAAELLLSSQPEPPTGPVARRLLREAGGNPLAIIELARAWTGEVAYWRGDPFPLTERLERLFAAQLADLPSNTRALLVAMAAADDTEWPAVLATLTGDPADAPATASDAPGDALVRAVEAGLVTVTGDGPVFRCPAMRSALYRAVSFEERRKVHLALAKAVEDDPDRRARHLAAAADGPDEVTAALLEAAGDRAERRGEPAEALRAMERAARLTPDARVRAGRLVKAARFALYREQVGKVEELAATVTALTDDPGILAMVPALVGWTFASAGRHDAAMALLIPAAEAAAHRFPSAALTTLAVAGGVTIHSGRRTHRDQLRQVLRELITPPGSVAADAMSSSAEPAGAEPAGAEPADSVPADAVPSSVGPPSPVPAVAGVSDPRWFWPEACADPLAARDRVIAALGRGDGAPGRDFVTRLSLGVLAVSCDLPAAAVEVLGPLVDPERDDAPAAGAGTYLTTYAFACFETGRWEKAESVAAYAVRVSEGLTPRPAPALALRATLAALRGRPEEARALAHRTLAATDAQDRLVTVRCERALGLAATAEGAHEAAYHHFRRLFTAGGEPVHDHHSYYALADLAGAAALTGHVEDARQVLGAAVTDLAGRSTERLTLLIGMARGLLAASDEDAMSHFAAALAGGDRRLDTGGRGLAEPRVEASAGTEVGVRAGDGGLGQWPFEWARAHLEYGQRLRRGHQNLRAREELSAALGVFDRLGASPWAERARIELRAAGVRPDASGRSGLELLTAQELQIVRLAGQGLTNKEIGERLFLSHRTVSSHLYRIFPKLGISTRAQLHPFVEGMD